MVRAATALRGRTVGRGVLGERGLDRGDDRDLGDRAAAPGGQRRKKAFTRVARTGPPVALSRYGLTPTVMLVAGILTICAQVGPFAFILIMHHVADGVMETRNYDTLIGFVLLFLILVMMSGAFLSLRGTLLAAAGERFGLRLRADVMQAAVRNAVHTDPAEGTALLQDVNTIQSFLRGNLPTIPFEMVAALLPLALMFYFDTILGLISLGGIVAAIIMGFVMHAATKPVASEARKRLQESSADLGGQLVHPDLVRGLGMLQASVLRWQPRYDAALRGMERMRMRTSAVEGMEDLVFTIYEGAVKGYAAYLLILHLGTLGLLMAVSFLSMQVINPFSALAKTWQAWAFTLQSWRRIQDALGDYSPPSVHPPDPTAPPGLVVEDASFHPPDRQSPIIGGLTLRLAPGTVITVEGPNGVGKSTLLRLILGLMAPTSGRVLLDGQDTYHCERTEFGARIGYLPQDVQLIEGHVFHNIGRGPDAPPEMVVAAARQAGAHDMIGRLPMGYQTPSGMTSGLSAGQRRLIGLARALYGDPRLLVLDEPEVGLDGTARMAMRTAVGAVRERGGITVIVTHEPGTWRGTADLRLVLSAGGGWQVQPADFPDPDGDRRPELAAPR